MLSKTFSMPTASQNSSTTFAGTLLWVFCSIYIFICGFGLLSFPGQKAPLPVRQAGRTLIHPTFIKFLYYLKVTRQRHIFHIFLKLYSVKWISNNHLHKIQCKLFYWFFQVLFYSMRFYNNKRNL